jgi:hypothetical protein
LVEFVCGQKELTSNIVTEAFNAEFCALSAHPSLAEPKMSELVEKGEGPCSSGVLIVDDDERCHVIRQGETTKGLEVDGRVVAPEISSK